MTRSVDIVPATLAGVPGEALLEQLQDYFEERREIAVDLEVRAPETVTVNIQVQVESQEGRNTEEVLDRVEQAVQDWFTGKLLGQDILRARLGHLIYSCDGVANYMIRPIWRVANTRFGFIRNLKAKFPTFMPRFAVWMKTAISTTTTTFIFVRNVLPSEWQKNEAGRLRHKSEIATCHK